MAQIYSRGIGTVSRKPEIVKVGMFTAGRPHGDQQALELSIYFTYPDGTKEYETYREFPEKINSTMFPNMGSPLNITSSHVEGEENGSSKDPVVLTALNTNVLNDENIIEFRFSGRPVFNNGDERPRFVKAEFGAEYEVIK